MQNRMADLDRIWRFWWWKRWWKISATSHKEARLGRVSGPRSFRLRLWVHRGLNIANVHVVIIGFACFARMNKAIYSNGTAKITPNISPYLIEGDSILITSRKKPICDVPEISMGNQAMDGGNLIIEEADYDDFIEKEPDAIPFIKRYSTAGAACQGQSRRCAAVLRTLDWQSRLCYLPRRDGGYILQSRPLSLDRERAGG